MKTLAQEYAEYSRTLSGDSVQPTIDTGFRMPSTESVTYRARRNPATKKYVDIVHAEDIKSFTETTLRGVNFITLDYAKIEARVMADIARNIRVRLEGADGEIIKAHENFRARAEATD